MVQPEDSVQQRSLFILFSWIIQQHPNTQIYIHYMQARMLGRIQGSRFFAVINLCLSLRRTSLQEVYFYLPSVFLSIYYTIIQTCTLFVHVWFTAWPSQCHKMLFNIVSPEKTWQNSLKNCNSLIRNVHSGPLETQCCKRKREKNVLINLQKFEKISCAKSKIQYLHTSQYTLKEYLGYVRLTQFPRNSYSKQAPDTLCRHICCSVNNVLSVVKV